MLLVTRFAKLILCVLIVVAGIYSQSTLAQLSGLGSDGWHSWQVRAVESAPNMCCFSWRSGSAAMKQCNLDGKIGGFSSSDDFSTSDGSAQVFALMESGAVTNIRVFSSSCPVRANSTINDLGSIDTDASAEWLKQFISVDSNIGSTAIAAIAVHDGQKSRDILVEAAKSAHDKDIREDAIFWMGQFRFSETSMELKDLVFNDKNSDIREHAAFSYSQSGAADVADVLIQQGRNDEDSAVRSMAWFWLAQTESENSEHAIRQALLNDADENVREEAVFALSQLPGERAVKALAAVVEDRQLGMDIREKALFWLAQTGSDEAFEYIDRLLSDN